MKEKRKIENFGTINLEKLEFLDDAFYILIPVESVSDDLQKRIDEAIEETKKDLMKEWKERNLEHCKSGWSEKGVRITYMSFNLTAVRTAMLYELSVGFVDKENDSLEADVSIPVDLSEHKKEIKKIVAHAIIDTFLNY